MLLCCNVVFDMFNEGNACVFMDSVNVNLNSVQMEYVMYVSVWTACVFMKPYVHLQHDRW